MIEKIKLLWRSPNEDDKKIAMHLLSTLDYGIVSNLADPDGLMLQFKVSYEEARTDFSPEFGNDFVIFLSGYMCLRISRKPENLYNSFKKNYKDD